LILFPQEELCPVCGALSQAKTYTRLKEILPLNEILHTIGQKKQELQKLCLELQSDFRAEARTTTNLPERGPHSQQPKHNTFHQPKLEPPSPKDPGGLHSKPVSLVGGLKAMFVAPKKDRLSRESSTLGTLSSSTKSEALLKDIKFTHLDNTEKNTTLSADGSLFVFWDKEQLEVHDDRGYKTGVPKLIRNPILVTASTNCCAVVGKQENYDNV
jgi:hypothetical protein